MTDNSQEFLMRFAVLWQNRMYRPNRVLDFARMLKTKIRILSALMSQIAISNTISHETSHARPSAGDSSRAYRFASCPNLYARASPVLTEDPRRFGGDRSQRNAAACAVMDY